MPCCGYDLRINNKHADVSCQIRTEDELEIRDYVAEGAVLPGEQVKVVRNNSKENEIKAAEIEVRPPGGNWQHGTYIYLGGVIAYLKWQISEIGYNSVCEVGETVYGGADSIPPYPGW